MASDLIPLIRWLRLELRYWIALRGGLVRRLRPIRLNSTDSDEGPRILVPLVETSHYQFYQMLVLAKALQLRGARVLRISVTYGLR